MKYIFLLFQCLGLTVTLFSQDKNRIANDANNKLQSVLDKTIDNKKVFGCSFAIKKGDYSWVGSSGNIGVQQPYFIASTTKLFTTAIVMQLRSEGKLKLEDAISLYLPETLLSGLHVYKNKEYSQEITIKQLLSHTSGLPDYFQDKGLKGVSLEDELKGGNDQYWTAQEAIDRSKKMKALFVPDTKDLAHYSDVNFQLLGLIIEKITGTSYANNCFDRIINPLKLSHTYLYTDKKDTTPKHLYYQTKPLHIPKAMASFGADGGMVSTSEDMLVFIQAFFQGKLFPATYLPEMQKKFGKIFFPMKSGMGIHKFELPWIFNPTGMVPVFIGHSGLSGALAYYCPKEDIYIVGTVNQISNPDLSFKTMIKITQVLRKF